MLLLVSTSDKVQVITGSAGTIDVHTSWMDNVAGAVAPGRTNTNISTAATTDVVGAPAASTQRNVKTMHIRNRGTAANVITVQHTDGTVVSQLHRTTLNPETTLQYIDEIGFIVLSGTAASGTTGDLRPTHKLAADPGWIMWVDGTIGDATSGSSILAATSTEALFALYYQYSDTVCPLLTSTGGPTTRAAQGLTAAAYAAHCRMSLPPGSGRALGIAGAGTGLTLRAVGDTTGLETTTPTVATSASHSHPWIDNFGGVNRVIPLCQYDQLVGGLYANQSFQGIYSVSGVSIGATGGGLPFNVMQPTVFINVMVKL